jgi:hypothetical protein
LKLPDRPLRVELPDPGQVEVVSRLMAWSDPGVIARAHERPGQNGADGTQADQEPRRRRERGRERLRLDLARVEVAVEHPLEDAPAAAIVIAPASTRFIASTPAAMPAFACGMAVIAAVDIGA